MPIAPGPRPHRAALLPRRLAVLVAAFLAAVAAATAVSPPSRAAVPYADLPAHLTKLGTATQSVVVTSSGWSSTYATLRAYEKRNGRWVLVMGPWTARVGYHGMRSYWLRKQGDGTTPAGTFGMTMAFGIQADPGTDLPYWRVRSRDQWWVGDRQSRYYNQPRWGSAGGFRLTEAGSDGSERLMSYPTQYAYAAVIDFNRPKPVVGRGTGIFLHVNGKGSTAGCVSVSQDKVVRILRWLDPAKHPKITIAPVSVVTSY